jgi:nitroreductase
MLEGALTRRTAERLIETAIAALSLHNSQPWRFVARLADRVIEIYADPTRTLRRGDPRGRAVHIACGSALFNLRLAIAQAGCEPVARLLPSRRDPLLLASVRLAGPYRPRPAERDLYAAIHRPIGRRPFSGHSLPRGLLSALREAAVLEGASLRQPDRVDVLPGVRGSPIPAPGKRAPSGVPAIRDFSPGPGGHLVPRAVFDAGAQLVVISTSADDRASWLRAGQAAQRVLLLAAHRGLLATPVSPAPEVPGAPAHGEPAFDGEHPAMILRLGRGQQWPAAARRPVAQVLRVVSPASVPQAAGGGQHLPAAQPVAVSGR